MPKNVTRFTLQTNPNPSFTVYNPSALDSYMDQVGGFAVAYVNGTTFAAKLDKKTWTKFADGTPVTDPSKFETMVHLPRLFFKANGNSIQLSPVELPDFRYFDSPEWIAAYKVSFDGELPHSCPGVAPQTNKTISQFWTEAQMLGEDWGLANYQFNCHIIALFMARFGNLNSQKVIGAGFQSSNWEQAISVPMGLLINLGDGSGSIPYESEILGMQHPVKLFGFEELWAKLWEFRPGIRFEIRDNVRYAIVYPGNIVSNTAEGREFVCSIQAASGAYTKGMILGEFFDIIADNVIDGSADTYYCDGFYTAITGQILRVGGHAGSGARAGLSCLGSESSFGGSGANIGARLAFFGSPTIIPGAEFVQLLATRRSMPAPDVPADDNRNDEVPADENRTDEVPADENRTDEVPADENTSIEQSNER